MYDGGPVVHRHFNADGDYVGHTEIESPWSDSSRDEAEALYEAEQMVCPHCGNLREDCSDPTRPWYPQRNVCYASAALEVSQYRYHEKHKDAKRSLVKPTLPTDGTTVWVSQHDLSPDDKFI